MYRTATQLRIRLNARLSHLPPGRRRAMVKRIIRDLSEVLQPLCTRHPRIEEEPEITREERVYNQLRAYERDPDYQAYLRALEEAETYGSRSCSL